MSAPTHPHAGRLHTCALWTVVVAAAPLLLASGSAPEHKRLQKLKVAGFKGAPLVEKFTKSIQKNGNDGVHGDVMHLFQSLTPKSSSKEVGPEIWTLLDYPEEWWKYFDTDKSGGLNYSEFMVWWRERRLIAVADLTEVHNPPKGHLQPLGGHKAPLSVDVIDGNTMHPRDFWRDYVEAYKPALLKGVEKDSVAYKTWNEDVLKSKFGWVEAKLEPKIEARQDDDAYKHFPSGHRLNVSEYLRREKTENIYVVSILPHAVAKDVNFPTAMLCGSRRHEKRSENRAQRKPHAFPHPEGHKWMTHLFEADFWMATGRTRSQLHYDKEQNVNCLYKGTKKWIFIDTRKWHNKVHWARGNNYNPENDLQNRWTDWVALNPDRVDLITHKDLRDVDYYEVIQEAGDCLYLPYAFLHWVNKTDPGLQVAVSYMWLPEQVYDEEACEQAPLKGKMPLAALDVLYYYSGKGIIPQGYQDPQAVVRQLRNTMRKAKSQYLTFKHLRQTMSHESILWDHKGELEVLFQKLTSFAKDPSKGLTSEELWGGAIPMGVWLKLACEADSEGPLPCDNGQRYLPISQEAHDEREALVQATLHKSKQEL